MSFGTSMEMQNFASIPTLKLPSSIAPTDIQFGRKEGLLATITHLFRQIRGEEVSHTIYTERGRVQGRLSTDDFIKLGARYWGHEEAFTHIFTSKEAQIYCTHILLDVIRANEGRSENDKIHVTPDQIKAFVERKHPGSVQSDPSSVGSLLQLHFSPKTEIQKTSEMMGISSGIFEKEYEYFKSQNPKSFGVTGGQDTFYGREGDLALLFHNCIERQCLSAKAGNVRYPDLSTLPKKTHAHILQLMIRGLCTPIDSTFEKRKIMTVELSKHANSAVCSEIVAHLPKTFPDLEFLKMLPPACSSKSVQSNVTDLGGARSGADIVFNLLAGKGVIEAANFIEKNSQDKMQILKELIAYMPNMSDQEQQSYDRIIPLIKNVYSSLTVPEKLTVLNDLIHFLPEASSTLSRLPNLSFIAEEFKKLGEVDRKAVELALKNRVTASDMLPVFISNLQPQRT